MRETTPSIQRQDLPFLKRSVLPWVICLIAIIFYFYDFILRITPSVMIHPLMNQYGFNATQIGLVSAFYFYAYTPLQIPSGIICDKYSIRWTLTFSAILCAAGALIFGMYVNFTAAIIGRIMMGVGSAFAFVGALKLAALWLPSRYFAFFSGLATSFGMIGAISSDTILSRMMVHIGWQHAIFITAIIGFVIALLIMLFVKDKPVWVSHAPKKYHSWKQILERVLDLLKSWRFWVIGIVGAFLFTPVSVFASLWGVAFLTRSYHLTATEGTTAASLVFIGMAFGGPLAGWFSSFIKNRRLPLFIGTLGCMFLSLILIYVDNLPVVTVLILLFLLGLLAGPEILVFAIAKEVSPPRSTGISSATTNFIVTLSAAIFQPIIGYLLTLNWEGVRTSTGIPIYSTHDFRFALFLIPTSLLLAFLLTFLVPKTRCQRVYKDSSAVQANSIAIEGEANA